MQVIAQKDGWKLESDFGRVVREGSSLSQADSQGDIYAFRVTQNGSPKFFAEIYLLPTDSQNTAVVDDFWGPWNDSADRYNKVWGLSGSTAYNGAAGFELNDDNVAERSKTFKVEVYEDLSAKNFGKKPVLTTTITIQDDDVNGTQSNDVLVGTRFADCLRGYSGHDRLRAGAGNDYLLGGYGNDTLYGEAGADTLEGGAGNDTYVIADRSENIFETARGGTDLVISSVSYWLDAHVEKLLLTDNAVSATGNSLANVLYGNDRSNKIDGLSGADTMAGAAGNDIYIVDHARDVVREGVSAGIDVARSSVSYRLGANVEKLSLTGYDAINGVGNSLANTLVGNDDSNQLWGKNNNDILYGQSGNDTLVGGVGHDSLIGGAGADVFVFHDLSDSTVAFSGRDLIRDFDQSQSDVISLRAINAVSYRAGDHAFNFIGTDRFSHTAGELRYEYTDTRTVIRGDVDGDGRSDFAISIVGQINLEASDFLL